MSLSPLSSGLYSSLFYTRYAGKTSLANWNGFKRNASSTCAVPSISSISGVTSTNIRSFGVRGGSIHVTRVSPLYSSISEKPWIREVNLFSCYTVVLKHKQEKHVALKIIIFNPMQNSYIFTVI